MIKLSPSSGGTTFTFDSEGINQLIQFMGKLFVGETSVSGSVLLLQKDGSQSTVNLIFHLGEHNTLKITKAQVEIFIEREDVDDALNRFRDAQRFPDSLYPEWIQVTNLANGKSSCLYVSFESKI